MGSSLIWWMVRLETWAARGESAMYVRYLRLRPLTLATSMIQTRRGEQSHPINSIDKNSIFQWGRSASSPKPVNFEFSYMRAFTSPHIVVHIHEAAIDQYLGQSQAPRMERQVGGMSVRFEILFPSLLRDYQLCIQTFAIELERHF